MSPSRSSSGKVRTARFLLVGLGLVVSGWAWTHTGFRDAEGALSGAFVLPAALSAGLVLSGLTWGTSLVRSGLWLALALAGQAATLQLIEAGHRLRYQHYKSPDLLLTEVSPVVLLIIAAQMMLVLWALRTRWREISGWLGRNFRWWQLAAVGIAFVLSSATVSPRVSDFLVELILAAALQTVHLGNIVLVALALPSRVREEPGPWSGFIRAAQGEEPSKPRRFVVLAAVWVTALSALLSVVCYQGHPHMQDEFAYLYLARYFAEGVMTMPAPPVPEAFDVYLMHFSGGVWFPSVPPGWPAFLAIGVLFGVPWLVNPLLAGVNVMLTSVLLEEVYDSRIARLGVLLLCVSPWHIFMAMNFMNHTITLTCFLLAAVALARARRGAGVIWGFTAGLAIGIATLVRPLDGVIIGALTGLWALGVGGSRLKVPVLASLALGAVLAGAAVLPYNAKLTGDPTLMPLLEYTEQRFGPGANAYGFGPDRGMGWPIDPFPGHGPLDALVNADLNLFSINVELFGWSIGSVLLASIFVFTGPLRRPDYLMLAVIAAVFTAYFFYYFSGGPDFGARYWYIMIIPCVALSARGIRFLDQKIPAGGSQGVPRVLATALVLAFGALIVFVPWRAMDKYYRYLDMRPEVREVVSAQESGNDLVLIRGASFPDYASAAIYNPLDVRQGSPVYAWDRDEETRMRLLEAYPQRTVWVVNGPTITGRGYEIAAGPVSVTQLLTESRRDP